MGTPLGPRGIRASDQRANQAQEFLLLWSVTGRDEKGSNLNIGDLATCGEVRFMPDEHPSGIRIAGQQPPIAVGTAVNLSRPNGHGGICSLFRPHHIVATGAVRHPQSRAADSNCGTTKTCFCHQHAHLQPRGLSARYRRPFPLNAAIVRPRSTAAAAVADT